jgi:glycosyltransferase involved in cell wall biosynthesis
MPEAISTITCCYNSASRLGSVLAALAAQELPATLRAEAILVDNCSTDGTAAMARSMWRRPDMPLRIISEPRQGLSFARETGLNAANSPLACFVDDDNLLSPGYLATALEIMQRYPQAAACGGRGIALTAGEIPAWMWRGWRSHAVGPQGDVEGLLPGSDPYVYGAGMVLRLAAWQQLRVAGFEPLLSDRNGQSLSSGGDVELCLALRMLGWQIAYSPRLAFDHFMPSARLNWEYCKRLFYHYGQANALLGFYTAWLGTPSFARWLRRAWLGAWLSCRRIEARGMRARKSAVVEIEGSLEVLRQHDLSGRADMLAKLRADGRSRKLFQRVRKFHRRCRDLAHAMEVEV